RRRREMDVADALQRTGQLLGLPRSIGALPVGEETVARAIGYKNNALTVTGPKRQPVNGASERQAPRRAGAIQVIDPDIPIPSIVGAVGELLAVRRNAWRFVLAGCDPDRFHIAVAAGQTDRDLRRGLRNVDERPR